MGRSGAFFVACFLGFLLPSPHAKGEEPRSVQAWTIDTSSSTVIHPLRGDPTDFTGDSAVLQEARQHSEASVPGFDNGTAEAGAIVRFDLETRQQVQLNDAEKLTESLVPYVLGEDGAGSAESPDNTSQGGGAEFSPRRIVTDTTVLPYRRVVKLWVTYTTQDGDERGSSCTGTLIGRSHVLTAAHCIYFHKNKDGEPVYDFVDKVTAIPALFDHDRPFGTATSVNIHAWQAYIDDADGDHDVALIELAWPIGALTGYQGYGWDDDCDFFLERNFTAPGYPAEFFFGELMYSFGGRFDDCGTILGEWDEEWLLAESSFSEGGQSGSGALRGSGSGIVYAVLSTSDRSSRSWFIRLTEEKFDDLENTIREETPLQDLIPINVHAAPTALRPRDAFTSVDYLVHNNSRLEWIQDIQARVYVVSEEVDGVKLITYLQTHEVDLDLAPGSSVRVNVSDVALPANLEEGSYELGVELLSDDQIPGNNFSDFFNPVRIDVLPVGCHGRTMTYQALIWPRIEPRSLNGRLSTADEAHSYEVLVREPGVYRFDLCASTADFDTFLCLYDDDFNLIDDNDSSICGRHAAIEVLLEPGTYQLGVSAADGVTGSYTLTHFRHFTCFGAPLDDRGSLEPLGTWSTVDGEVRVKDADVYTIEVETPATYTFSFCVPGAIANVDTALCLFNSFGDRIAEVDDVCGLGAEIVETLYPGSYFLSVASGSRFGGDYRMAYRRVGACNGRPLLMAGVLTPDLEERTLNAVTPGDGEGLLYEVNANQAATYVFHTCASPEPTSYDSVMCLYDDEWRLVAENDVFCENDQPQVDPFLRPGTYYLAVSGTRFDKGAFVLTYSIAPACNGRPLEEVGSITPAINLQTQPGELTSTASTHAYTVNAETGAKYIFSLCGPEVFDTYLCLYDANWNYVTDNNNTCRRNAQITIGMPAGTYRLAVSGNSTSIGPYELTHYKIPMCSRMELDAAGTIEPSDQLQQVEGDLETREGHGYRVIIHEPAEYVFSTCKPYGRARINSYLCLYDLEGTTLRENDDHCEGASEVIRFLPAGEYFLGVTTERGTDSGGYTLGFRTYVPQGLWIRCDHNCDSTIDISDAVGGLNQLFIDARRAACCEQVANCNNDPNHDITDWVFLLGHLFLGGPAPPAPFPECGGEGCPEFSLCE